MAIVHENETDTTALAGLSIAVVGYGNQGRSWALNLRDSGFAPTVCVRADETRAQAGDEGFETAEIQDAASADIVCLLVPDDAIPALPIDYRPQTTVLVASGYTPAFDRLTVAGDIAMVAPRMLGSEVRACYLDGTGFVTAIGVEQDNTGSARERMLAVAAAIGGLRRGGIEMTAMQEAVLDLSVEQLLSPALTHVSQAFVTVMLEQGIPLEAVLCELYLSGEVERNYRLLREEGFVAQLDRHSPTSQYGQLSRRGRYDHLDLAETMRALAEEITSGKFADEWDGERDAGHPGLAQLREVHASAEQAEFEQSVREAFEPG